MAEARPILLDAREVTVRFGGLKAVDAVSARFHSGELVGIIGPNGAGKTTFFNAISGVTPVTSGQLIANGRDLTGKGPHHFAASGLARTFQTPRVFADMSVAANIDFGLQFAGRHRLAPWLLRDASNALLVEQLGGGAGAPAWAALAGKLNLASQALLDYLAGAEARAVWSRHGFGVPR